MALLTYVVGAYNIAMRRTGTAAHLRDTREITLVEPCRYQVLDIPLIIEPCRYQVRDSHRIRLGLGCPKAELTLAPI